MQETELFFLIDSVAVFVEKLIEITDDPIKSYAKQEWYKFKDLLTASQFSPLKCFSYSNALILSKQISAIPIATFRLNEVEIETNNKQEKKNLDSFQNRKATKIEEKINLKGDIPFFSSNMLTLSSSNGFVGAPLKEVSLKQHKSPAEQQLLNQTQKFFEGMSCNQSYQNEGQFNQFQQNMPSLSFIPNNSCISQITNNNLSVQQMPKMQSLTQMPNNLSYTQLTPTPSAQPSENMQNFHQSQIRSKPYQLTSQSPHYILNSTLNFKDSNKNSINTLQNISSCTRLLGTKDERLKSPSNHSIDKNNIFNKQKSVKYSLQKLKGPQQTTSPLQNSFRNLASTHQIKISSQNTAHQKAQKSLQIDIKGNFQQKFIGNSQNSARSESSTSRNGSKGKEIVGISITPHMQIPNYVTNLRNMDTTIAPPMMNNNSINLMTQQAKTEISQNTGKSCSSTSTNSTLMSSQNGSRMQAPQTQYQQVPLSSNTFSKTENRKSYEMLIQNQSNGVNSILGSGGYLNSYNQGSIYQNNKLISPKIDFHYPHNEKIPSHNHPENFLNKLNMLAHNNPNNESIQIKELDKTIPAIKKDEVIEDKNEQYGQENGNQYIRKKPRKETRKLSLEKFQLNIDIINSSQEEKSFSKQSSQAQLQGTSHLNKGFLQVLLNRFDQDGGNNNMNDLEERKRNSPVNNRVKCEKIGEMQNFTFKLQEVQTDMINPYQQLSDKVKQRLDQFKMDTLTLTLISSKFTNIETKQNKSDLESLQFCGDGGFSERTEIKRGKLRKYSVFAKKGEAGQNQKKFDDQISKTETLQKDKKSQNKNEAQKKKLIF